MPELIRWLNGWVYSLFGADALVAFQAHPLLYTGLALGGAGVAVLTVLWWLSRRVRRALAGMRLAAALSLTPEGRRALALARRIRQGGRRLRGALGTEALGRAERRELLDVLARFARSDAQAVLRQALRLIRRADDRRMHLLQGELDWQQRAWNAASDDAERERLQQAVAATRHQLARVTTAGEARDAHLLALQEAAEAVQALEDGLVDLELSRDRALPHLRDKAGAVARQVGDLSAAYRRLDEPE